VAVASPGDAATVTPAKTDSVSGGAAAPIVGAARACAQSTMEPATTAAESRQRRIATPALPRRIRRGRAPTSKEAASVRCGADRPVASVMCSSPVLVNVITPWLVLWQRI